MREASFAKAYFFVSRGIYVYPGGGHLYFMLDIILVKRLSRHTLNTYFSGMKIDPKSAFLHAFFLICVSCPFQNLSIWPKTYRFSPQFCPFCTPKRCTRVHYLVLWNNPNYVNFFTRMISNFKYKCPPPGAFIINMNEARGYLFNFPNKPFKGCRMGSSDKVSLWYVALLINTRFRFLIKNKQLLSTFNVTLRQRTSKWLREPIKLIILPIKSKMTAAKNPAKKRCFLRFLYFTESSPPSFKVRGLYMTMNLAVV